ncbi:MAG: dTMP kinase [Candidatus Micrarchaeota archaeon]
MEMTNKLIVFEGLDGSGKTVQIELLRKKYPDAMVFKYPTKSFQMLNDYLEKKLELSSKSLFLLFLSDIANEQELVRVALDSGKTVILDRYVFSTISYELADIHFPQAKKIVEGLGFLKPDEVILLDIPPEVSQERKMKQKKLDRYEENRDYLAKVRGNFLRLEEERFLTPNWHKVDASKGIESVHADIMKLLR